MWRQSPPAGLLRRAAIDPTTKRLRLRVGALLAAVLSSGLVVVLLVSLEARGLADSVASFDGPDLLLLVAAIAALSLVLTPAALLAGAAGYVAGVMLGTLMALCGLSLGAVLCAAVARWAGTRDAAAAFGPRAQGLAQWIRARPLHSIFVARLIPGVPFHLLSYAAGLSGVGLWVVFFATAAGFAPRCFLFAALGGSIGNLGQTETQVALAVSVFLFAASVLLARRKGLRSRL